MPKIRIHGRIPTSRPMLPPWPPAGAAWIMLMRIGGLDMKVNCFPLNLSLAPNDRPPDGLWQGWSGRLDSNQRPPHPQCDALPGCATPRLGRAHLGSATSQGKVRAGVRVARRRRKGKSRKWFQRVAVAILLVPALYLLAALVGSLVPVNRDWAEPAHGTTVYLADNGIHADIVMPIAAHGLDWRRDFPPGDFARADPNASFIAFGSGERRVYLDTPTWWDLT